MGPGHRLDIYHDELFLSHHAPCPGIRVTAPLAGIRVLDVTRGMAGAIASMILADYGADVIALDSGFDKALRTWDRGKRHVEFAGADARSLAADADVVLVGLPLADARAAGLDAASVCAANPDVVYVAMTGFGLDDQRDTPAVDTLVGAELGTMITVPAAHRDGPVFNGHPAVAYSTAFVAAAGTLAALRARIVAGHGDIVDASMLDGVLAQFTMNWWTERKVSFLSNRRADGQLDLGRTRMLVRRYECGDGKLIQVHTGAAGGFGRLMKVLGVDDRISPVTSAVESASPLTDDDLAVLETLPELFAKRTADEWLRDIWANEVAALPVQAPGLVFSDEQAIHNQLIRTIDDPELGPIDVVAPPIRMSRSPAVTSDPSTVADTAAWRAAGLGPGGSATLRTGPLDGINVVEFATFFASPYANRFLRDLGATRCEGRGHQRRPDPFAAGSVRRSVTRQTQPCG